MSHNFCVHKRVLGTDRHFSCIDGKYVWSSDVSNDAWLLDGSFKLVDRCLDTLVRLNGSDLKLSPPERFVNAFSQLTDRDVPWRLALPKDVHDVFMRGLIDRVQVFLSTTDVKYSETVWKSGSKVLRSLDRAKIDEQELSLILAGGTGNIPVVKTFMPLKDGFTRPITYDRFGTRTGRLTVDSGPLILTLKREYRYRLLTSRYEGGKIVELDTAALEPRIMLHEVGKHNDDVDLYESLNASLFGGKAKRDVMKGSVISQLYGMHKRTLKKKLNATDDEVDAFIDGIAAYFETSKLLKRVKDEFLKNGHITNRFGRRVEIEIPVDRMFVNSYVQSSGVDVAIMGFEQVLTKFDGLRVHPLFLIVDAILFDVHPEDLASVMATDRVFIDGVNFPLKIKVYE